MTSRMILLSHELMHRDERRASTSKRSRETEAEAVAFVVCQSIGLETGSAAQDYIQYTATRILNTIGAEESSAPPV